MFYYFSEIETLNAHLYCILPAVHLSFPQSFFVFHGQKEVIRFNHHNKILSFIPLKSQFFLLFQTEIINKDTWHINWLYLIKSFWGISSHSMN